MNDFKFGDLLLVDYGKEEQYKGIVFGDKIGYEDGQQDLLKVILEQEQNKVCTITKLN